MSIMSISFGCKVKGLGTINSGWFCFSWLHTIRSIHIFLKYGFFFTFLTTSWNLVHFTSQSGYLSLLGCSMSSWLPSSNCWRTTKRHLETYLRETWRSSSDFTPSETRSGLSSADPNHQKDKSNTNYVKVCSIQYRCKEHKICTWLGLIFHPHYLHLAVNMQQRCDHMSVCIKPVCITFFVV